MRPAMKNPFKDGVPEKPQVNRFGKIVKADYTGDTAIATFEPGVDNDAAKVAQDELTAFLNECIRKHGQQPPVFARRIGESEMTPFFLEGRPKTHGRESGPSSELGTDRIVETETILIQQPLVGG